MHKITLGIFAPGECTKHIHNIYKGLWLHMSEILYFISEVSKTIDYINTVKILEQTARVNGKKIVEYYVTLDLAFTVDRERED